MESYVLLFTISYILFSVCLIFPPSEFVSVGLTVESIFSFWLKDEADCFIHHHIKRTAATVVAHCSIPLGYVIGIRNVLPEITTWDGNILWWVLVVGTFTLPILAIYRVLDWSNSNWRNHPIARNLMSFTTSETNINDVARDIDNEYKRIDKIIIKCNAVMRVVVTDNWIMKITPYMLYVANQNDATLVVSSSSTHLYVPGRPEGGQYLNIDVRPNRPNVQSFQIRINSVDFKDLQDKIYKPIVILNNVVVYKSLSDRFLEAFQQQTQENPHLTSPKDLDLCIGCMMAMPNVKLHTSCGDTSGPNACTRCNCKPMWCIDCMGKWFASRQDQAKPETWLSSKCTCPMCRSTFCILDVCPLNPPIEDVDDRQ